MRRSLLILIAASTIFITGLAFASPPPPIVNLFKSQGERFATKGKPFATDNLHDIPNFRLNLRTGAPGQELRIEFNGKYRYLKDGVWGQQAVTKIEINWGDNSSVQTLSSSSWPKVAKHKYAVDSNGNYTVDMETTYVILMKFYVVGGNTYNQRAEYTIHENPSGVASPSGAANVIRDYWENNDCIMINNVCNIESVIHHKKPTVDISANPITDPHKHWSHSNVSYYSGISSIRKPVTCNSPKIIHNGLCATVTEIPQPSTYRSVITKQVGIYDEQNRRQPVGTSDYYQSGSLPIVTNVSYRNIRWKRIRFFGASWYSRRSCNVKTYLVEREGNQVVFKGSCIRSATLTYCQNPNQQPISGPNGLHCGEIHHPPKYSYSYDAFYKRCKNTPSLLTSYGNGSIDITGDFHCYQAITVRNVCYSPFSFKNNQCEWDEIIRTPVYDETSADIPVDTYRN